ncbi:hypothetical protein [Bacillus wiedmannii]|uniref:hypothetical protein n=1 Tax=Bacillus wiedmannii TaxID=1890302 RepID=UPI000BF1AE3A|nr:hypothetical protein [Bacillus wiedmannii]MCU5330658.1 hypothetical protein [Bacillus wiedmannii]PEL82384.1 hypothetical protein CN626_30705 [Bacillus wiedmannii]
MNRVDMKKNSKEMIYSSIIEKLHENLKMLKEELKQVVTNECKTYGEVEKYLLIKKKEAQWNQDELQIFLIETVENDFTKEMNNLSLQ